VADGSEIDRLAENGWIEWGGQLIWVVGFTSGGAPYGLSPSDFDPAELEAMGFPDAAVSLITDPDSWLPDSGASRGSEDAWF
jgi:hypothetical protein